MRIGGELYFSQKFKFVDLDLNDKEGLLEAFKDRVEGFYLRPAKLLNKEKNGFACGLICLSAIDFLSRIRYKERNRVGMRNKKWITEYLGIPDIGAKQIYEQFRNGLVHEGRVKELGQFWYKSPKLTWIEKEQKSNVMLINPDKLLASLEKGFSRYLIELKEDNQKFELFRKIFVEDFGDEIKKAKRLR